MRKTFDVQKLKETVNETLLSTGDQLEQWRQGQIVLMSSILMEVGQYNGYRYLNKEDMADSEYGDSVGIRDQKPGGSWDFSDTDSSRIQYF